MPGFYIKNRLVGESHPPLVIAELGINHGGSIEIAMKLADLAIKSGAEIIKSQTHLITDEMSEEAKNVIPGNASVSIFEIIQKCALSQQNEIELKKYVESRGCIYISTPFSRSAVDFLDELNVPAFKIGSGECNNYPLVEHIARKRKPIILSTGMNSIDSIRPSVEIFRKYKIDFALLHCTNLYPTSNHLIRLSALNQLKNEFPDAVIGLSDHSVSNASSYGAVALGASIIERHFTDSKSRSGPDIVCSMTPSELKELIDFSFQIFQSLQGDKIPLKEEEVTSAFAFSSLVAIKDISAGEILTQDNCWVMRPSGGYPANQYFELLGKKVKVDVKTGFQIPKGSIT
jgi:sialic acid synthase SpsE